MSTLTYRFVCHKLPQDLMKCALAMVSNEKVALGPKKVGDPWSRTIILKLFDVMDPFQDLANSAD